jgi:hypothetical protein
MSERGPGTNTMWTPEREAELRRLAGLGWSAPQIGRKLGCTRNAAISKMVRLGIPRGVAASAPSRVPAVKPMPRNPVGNLPAPMKVGGGRVYAQVPPRPLPRQKNGPPGLCTIHTLTMTSCRWPVGEPSAGMTYCGATALDGKPYCGTHHLVCYAGLPPKKARAA